MLKKDDSRHAYFISCSFEILRILWLINMTHLRSWAFDSGFEDRQIVGAGLSRLLMILWECVTIFKHKCSLESFWHLSISSRVMPTKWPFASSCVNRWGNSPVHGSRPCHSLCLLSMASPRLQRVGPRVWLLVDCPVEENWPAGGFGIGRLPKTWAWTRLWANVRHSSSSWIDSFSRVALAFPNPCRRSLAAARRTRCHWSAKTLSKVLLSITFCEPDWKRCGQMEQYNTDRAVLWDVIRVSMVWVDTGKAERLDSVDKVRYIFGRQGHSGVAGSCINEEGSASGSREPSLWPAIACSCLSWTGTGRVISEKSGQEEISNGYEMFGISRSGGVLGPSRGDVLEDVEDTRLFGFRYPCPALLMCWEIGPVQMFSNVVLSTASSVSSGSIRLTDICGSVEFVSGAVVSSSFVRFRGLPICFWRE